MDTKSIRKLTIIIFFLIAVAVVIIGATVLTNTPKIVRAEAELPKEVSEIISKADHVAFLPQEELRTAWELDETNPTDLALIEQFADKFSDTQYITSCPVLIPRGTCKVTLLTVWEGDTFYKMDIFLEFNPTETTLPNTYSVEIEKIQNNQAFMAGEFLDWVIIALSLSALSLGGLLLKTMYTLINNAEAKSRKSTGPVDPTT